MRMMTLAVGIILLYVFMQQYTFTKSWTGLDMMTTADNTIGQPMPAPSAIQPLTASVNTPVINPSDLLPANGPANSFFGTNTIEGMSDQPLLPPPAMSLKGRNANLSIRPDPCIPRQNIGIWNQTTIDVNTGGECGGGVSNNVISA